MVELHPPRSEAPPEREPLRMPSKHRNEGALQRALRQERVMRRRNFFSWLLTLLLATGAGVAIVYWLAAGRAGGPPLSPTTATPTSVVPVDPILQALPAASEAVPLGAEHALPAR